MKSASHPSEILMATRFSFFFCCLLIKHFYSSEELALENWEKVHDKIALRICFVLLGQFKCHGSITLFLQSVNLGKAGQR